jgi:alkanesulfonate monooxygenase SsuD/methylene tetrahydromethanopterin reductase-like flavin-dependent oxidoreductase (luciferase family)
MTRSDRPVHPWIAAGTDQVRFGIFRFPGSDLAVLQDEMRHLESAGFDGVYMPDHPMVAPDPWVSFAAMATATTTMRLGALISCVAYRHPAMLARAVADVDALSGGRVVLGLGSGDMPAEFDMLGLTYGGPADRRALLAQTLAVVPSLLRGEPVTAEGPGFALRNAVLPAPRLQQPGVPILVAGGSRGTLRLAAEHADAVNIGPAAWAGGAYSNDDVEHRFGLLDELCAAAGRPPGSVLRTGLLGISVASTRDEAQAVVDAVPREFQAFLRGFFVAGTPDDIVRHLHGVIDSGYRYLVFFMADILSGSLAMTDRLIAEVLPQVDRQCSGSAVMA